ncbi:MerR family transcriptional regulator [Oscillatoria sp. FACHB-1407]|uniref:MerR family transcriptional regulator n=1 Tax=Oscillatoria sp. FACHB-1407 TaxID=2692847 RepID=UPI00168A218D|nr:MerR family transcriptional regulator [Oscillatoria sp. FACHB-1407]MBD2465461.1 MerR family transcriptional regulator [Oscillatoria sp. FACHB-1407]
MLTVSEVAHIFGVDRNTIKKWAYKFRDYLSSKANPSKGEIRYFTQEDLMVLALVSYYWEEEPDYEHIYAHLNSKDHYSDCYVAVAYVNTPIFQDIPDDFEGGEYPALIGFGGWKQDESDLSFRIANAYKIAGDQLVETAISSHTAYELFYPIVFAYRHALEVYLKILLYPNKYEKTHELSPLIHACQIKFGKEFSKWSKDRLYEFEEMDCYSDAFRYADSKTPYPTRETIVNLRQLRVVVDHLCTDMKNLARNINIPPVYLS